MLKPILAIALIIPVVAACSIMPRTAASDVRAADEIIERRQVVSLNEMMSAVNAGDAARYARVYAAGAVITIHGGGELRGRGAIEQYEVGLLREFPGTRFAIYAIWRQGAVAAVHYGVNSPVAGGNQTGHEGLLFYHFDSAGLIVTERRYLDSMTPMAQMGLLGATPARAVPTLPTAIVTQSATGTRVERENIATVRDAFARLQSKDEPAFLASLADGAVVDELIQPQPYAGAPAAKKWFEYWNAAVPDAIYETVSMIGVGDFVLAETILRGTLRGPIAPLSGSGKPFSVHRAWIVRLKGGRLAEVTSFMNRKELAEAVGQWPPSRKE